MMTDERAVVRVGRRTTAGRERARVKTRAPGLHAAWPPNRDDQANECMNEGKTRPYRAEGLGSSARAQREFQAGQVELLAG